VETNDKKCRKVQRNNKTEETIADKISKKAFQPPKESDTKKGIDENSSMPLILSIRVSDYFLLKKSFS
jgi:hypothetical protein